MADNVILPGAGTPVASNEIGGIQWQYLKMAFGANGTATPVDSAAPLPVSDGSHANAALSNVASSATTVLLAGARANRRGFIVVNDSTTILFIAYAATASATAFTYKLSPGSTWEMPKPAFSGQISGIWDSVNGNARITDCY